MLKDWKNIRKSKGVSTWKNKKSQKYLWINNTGFGWVVTIGNKEVERLFSSKKEALDYAKNYMRRN